MSLPGNQLLGSGLAFRMQSLGGEETGRLERGIVCGLCFQPFAKESSLQIHVQQTHGSVFKPFECSTCHKRFASSTYLSQHSRIHLGIKPFTCPLCSRRFTQLCHLQQHVRTHTGEKPYKCQNPGCDKAFSQLSNLRSHCRSHLSTKTYSAQQTHLSERPGSGQTMHLPIAKRSTPSVLTNSTGRNVDVERRHQAAVSSTVTPRLLKPEFELETKIDKNKASNTSKVHLKGGFAGRV